MAAYEVLLLNTTVPQIQAAQSGDTYVVPRDIAFSAALTLSAGTANGVAFLNASKVLTTGSALTFDGTKLSLPTVLAVKGAQNSNLAKVVLTRTDASYSINNETDLRFYAQTTDTESPANILHSMNTGGTFVWNNGSGSEQMRLTSTGLGIGTSSPGAKLEINAGANTDLRVNTSGSGYLQVGQFTNGAFIGTSSTDATAGILRLGTGGTTRATIDTSGNLGLGVTPSAWAGYKALQVASTGGAISSSSSSDMELTTNAYYSSGWLSQGAGVASSRYRLNAGTHAWFTAPSGTAGNAITFTQAMTLDASGRLGIGKQNPARALDISSAASIDTSGAANKWTANFRDTSASAINVGGSLLFQGLKSTAGSVGNFGAIAGLKENSTDNNENGYLAFYTVPNSTQLITERARITSGGDFQTSSGNSVMIGGTAARATTAGTNRLDIFDGTAPVGTLANGVSFYSTAGEARVMDAAGNATLLSPHDAKTNEWIFHSKHTPTGKVLKIDVERLLKFVNDHFGLDAVHEFIEK